MGYVGRVFSTIIVFFWGTLMLDKKLRSKEGEIRDLRRKLTQKETEIGQFFNNSNFIFWSLDLMDQTFSVSAGVEKFLGLSQEQFSMDSTLWTKHIHPDDLNIHQMNQLITIKEPSFIEYRIIHPSGDTKWVEENITPLLNREGEIVKLYGIVNDITARKNTEDKIKRKAYHDPLTGLPNRLFLLQRVDWELAKAKREKAKMGIVFLDLDGFKQVNDSFGHDVGDALLQEVSSRIKKSVREGDTVARYGGDEFVILCPNITRKRTAEIMQRILEAVRSPYVIKGNQICVSASIGIAIYPEHGREREQLINYADVAMYQAKQLGKNNYQIFEVQETI
jgi:diguanylate cyclase (GGDEF)-like protein/PAS domain S-box-containing protein